MPMMGSTAEFNAAVGGAVTRAIKDVIERCYQELQVEIQNDIYAAYSPEDYERSYGLLTSWQRIVGMLSGELKFEPSMLPIGGWTHTSLYDGGDTRAVILDILEAGYRAYNAKTGKPIPARPMWDKFIAKVDANFDSWMRAALRKQGLIVV